MDIINNYFNIYQTTDDIDNKKYYKSVLCETLVNKKYSGIILQNWDKIVEIILTIGFIDNADVQNFKVEIENKYQLLNQNNQSNKLISQAK